MKYPKHLDIPQNGGTFIFCLYAKLESKIKTTDELIKECISESKSRSDFWIRFINNRGFKSLAEIGVWRGDFAKEILRNCDSITKYYMIDPWRHLEDWKKPLNIDNETFQNVYNETLKKTAFAEGKRIILRGKTTEVINQISNESLDFAYIDGDHTLKGIAIDLINVYPKIKEAGWIGGDDFCKSIWQHPAIFEPTLVFPFAIYFAEAMSAKIFALPYNQFLIEKMKNTSYDFVDFTGEYKNIGLRDQFIHFRDKMKMMFPFLVKLKRFFNK